MKPILRLLPVMSSRPGLLIETVLWSAMTHVGVLLLALGLSLAVGKGIAGEGIPAWLLPTLLALGVMVALAAWRESWVSHDLAYRLIGYLRLRVFDALRRALPSRRRHRRSGDLATAVMADIETLEWLYAHTAAQVLSAALVLLTSITVSILITPLLLLVWLPLLAVGVAVPTISARRARQAGDAHAAGAAELRAELLDTVRGLRELDGADALGAQIERLGEDTRSLARIQMHEASRLGAERGIADVTLALATVGAILVVLIDRDAVAAPMIPLAVTVAVAGIAPAAQIADLLRSAGTLRAAAERVLDVLAQPPALPEGSTGAPVRAEVGLVLDGVSFSYDGRRKILDDVALHVSPGEIVALTGPTGAGKTTVARLAHRMWDPDAGSIRLDGVDLRDLPDDDLRDRIAVVPQSSPLMRGTIRSNIVLGDPDATADAIDAAARSAGLLRPESGLPLGLETPIGEHGSGVSGGQRARVAIARALLRNPRLLVLDEATASLDPEADAAMLDVLKKLDGPAVLLVAHRPATIAAADRIVRLEAKQHAH